MRPMEKPASSHDSDVLAVPDGNRFRQWLVSKGVRVRSAKGTDKAKKILYWVRPEHSNTWLSVDAPAAADGQFLRTHRHLRPYLNDFLLKPLNASVKKATRQTPAIANTNGLGPAPVYVSSKPAPAKQAAKADRRPGAVVLPLGTQLVHAPEAIEELRKNFDVAPMGCDLVADAATLMATRAGGYAADPAPPKKCAGTCGNPCTSPAKPSAPAVVLDSYLAELRDDFALHAPVTQKEGESLQSFAGRRWAYAQAMIEARPTNVRG